MTQETEETASCSKFSETDTRVKSEIKKLQDISSVQHGISSEDNFYISLEIT